MLSYDICFCIKINPKPSHFNFKFLNTKNMKDKPISSIRNKSYQVEVD